MADAPSLASAEHRFSADRPLEKIADDKLDRGEFAERLAADIARWHGKDSLVVSVNGQWGSGKTTLKNFVKECLDKKGAALTVEFNPWQWSGQDKLLEGFFGAIRAKFVETDAKADTEALVARWEKLAAWTKLGATISDKFEKVITPLLGGSVAAALIANTSSTPWVRNLALGLGLVGVVASSFFAIFPELAAQFIEAVKTRGRPTATTMEGLRAEISAELNKLRKKNKTVLVVIDDIDRLSAEEIRLLFQLVKVNADFPSLVYLLLFQKNLVTDALSKVTADSGAEYLKKIVQVEFDVPQASRERMLTIFQDGLNKIVQPEMVQMRWNKERIGDLFEDELWPYFSTLRDVKRFLGTFDFYFNGHVNNGVLEVNPVDLLAIEVLRTFDHEAYLAIRDSLGYSYRGRFLRLMFGAEERSKRVKVEIDAIINRPGLPTGAKDRLGNILRALFPDSRDGEFTSDAERDLRICHPHHFAKYFEHTLDDKATSAANVRALLQLVPRRSEFVARIRAISNADEVEEVFKKIGLHIDEIPPDAAESFIGALFDVGDTLPKAKIDWISNDVERMATRMCYWLLRKLPDSATRKAILDQCFQSSTGVVLPVLTVAILEPRRGEREAEPRLVDEADLASLREAALKRIKALATSGEIWRSRHFQLYLYRWRDWAGQDDVNGWLATALDTPQRKLEFLTRMICDSIINGQRVEHYLNAKSIEDFVNLEALAQEIANVPAEGLSALARTLLARALQLKAGGSNYSEVREKGDFG